MSDISLPNERLWTLLATFGGIGYAKVAPGTFGTIPGVLIWYFSFPYIGTAWYLFLCLFITLLSIVAAGRAGIIFGEPDAGAIVIDEVAGVMCALIFVPHGIAWAIAAFLIFRFFDILKIWPASYFDRKMKNGYGVTLDDLVAGAYTCVILNAAVFAIPLLSA